jgi:hypothetical protein
MLWVDDRLAAVLDPDAHGDIFAAAPHHL